jgi:hypothetical protein
MAAIGHAPRSASHVLQLAMRAASAYPLELEPLERALLVLRRIFSKGGVLIVLAGILYVYLSKCARTVSTGQIGIVEQLGKFNRIATPGDPPGLPALLAGSTIWSVWTFRHHSLSGKYWRFQFKLGPEYSTHTSSSNASYAYAWDLCILKTWIA